MPKKIEVDATADLKKKTTKKTGKPSGSKTAAPKKAAPKKAKDGKKIRYFKLVEENTKKSFGRYVGGTPKQAASKGYTKLVKKYKTTGKSVPKSMVIYMRESTRGGSGKMYAYTASQEKIKSDPVPIKDKETGKPILNKDGTPKLIKYEHRNQIRRAVIPDEMAGGASKKKSKAKVSKKKKSPEKAKVAKKSGSKTASKKPVKKVKKASKK